MSEVLFDHTFVAVEAHGGGYDVLVFEKDGDGEGFVVEALSDLEDAIAVAAALASAFDSWVSPDNGGVPTWKHP